MKVVMDTMAEAHLKAVIVRVTIDGQEIVTRAVGESMPGVPATTEMHFRNGAVAISYVATALLQLVDETQVTLDDKVSNDGRPGLPGPLSHLGLGRSGRVYVIAAGLCSHTGRTFRPDHGNGFAIGIEAEGTGTAPWPAAQLDAYAALCAALTLHYGLGVGRVLGHKEIAAPAACKIDPNFDMDEFRRRVARLREDDLFTAADRQLLTRLARRLDVGFARDQILAELKALSARIAELEALLAPTEPAGEPDALP